MSYGYITEKRDNVQVKEFYLPGTIDGYTPKNKKCFCYPYCYIELNNYVGSTVNLKYENFRQENADVPLAPGDVFKFAIAESVSMSPTIGCVPIRYEANDNVILVDGERDGGEVNPHYMITYTDFSQLPYTYDNYANWYALNSYSQMWKTFETTLGAVTGVAMGNPLAAVSGAGSLIGQQIGILDKKKTPDSLIGKVNGDFHKFFNLAGIYYNEIQSKTEYIHMVDDYFTRYGYLINETITPTFDNRTNFDYIQTVDCNIVGNIPQEDIDELEAIFNNGVTIWHNENTYGDYDVANPPRGT